MTPWARLRRALDAAVIGHDPVKRALILALVCREHVYLEGPPGTAKTRMAEVVARASGLRFFCTQLHRDTRLPELLGDVILERRQLLDGGGEQIQHRIDPGRILTADVCVLDDISRAPGEALNVLLQVLNERRFEARPIPLLCAIATGNPTDDSYANEALDPAHLDRFALQLRVSPLLGAADSSAARALLDRFADAPQGEERAVEAVLTRSDLDAAYARLVEIDVPRDLRDALLRTLRALVREHGCSETNALLTDRTFLVKALKLLRGSALIAGRARVAADDFEVLSWMATFRVPAAVHEKLPDVIASSCGGS